MLPVRQFVATCLCLAAALVVAPLLETPARAQTVGDTPAQTNERIKELSAAAAKSAPRDYLIGNGDLLDVEVFDVKELSRDVRVSQTGTIGIPLVPVRLYVAGLTEMQAGQKVSEVLEADGLVSSASVTVTVKEHKSQPITIVGAVGHAMVYPADHQVTLLELLAEAGGIANDAGDSVIITRPASAQFVDVSGPAATGPEQAITAGAEPPSSEPPSLDNPPPSAAPEAPAAAATSPAARNTITINLDDLVEKGNTSNNIPLMAGDIVTVPHAGVVYVLGAVGKPGGYILSSDRGEVSTLKILALAGGMTGTAKSDHAVIIRRNEQGQQHEVEVDLRKVLRRETEDVQLLPSDILYVPDSRAKAALLHAAELGVALGSGIALYRLAYH